MSRICECSACRGEKKPEIPIEARDSSEPWEPWVTFPSLFDSWNFESTQRENHLSRSICAVIFGIVFLAVFSGKAFLRKDFSKKND